MSTPAPTAAPSAATNGATPPVAEGSGAPGQAPAEAPPDAASKKSLALLMKKERGLALKAHDLAQKAQALKDREAEYQAWQSERAAIKRDPVRFLEKEFGKDWYDKMTEVKLSGGKVTPELVLETIDEKLESFEKRQAEERQKAMDAARDHAAKQEQEFFASWRKDVTDFVKANASEYELINHFEVQDRVTAKIESEFAKTKKLLTPKEAADLVEKDLEERGAKSKKLGRAPAAPSPGSAVPADKRNDPPQRRALSNDMSPSTQATRPPPKDDAERRLRALEAMAEAERRRKQA